MDPENADAKKPEDLSYTYQGAKALADGAIQAAGITAEAVEVDLLEGFVENEERPISEQSRDYTALRFQYARTVEGISLTAAASEYMGEEAFSLIWPYEKLKAVVSEVGIRELESEAPVSVEETVEKDVAVLSPLLMRRQYLRSWLHCPMREKSRNCPREKQKRPWMSVWTRCV